MSAWNLAPIWNAATLDREERERIPRDYMWASELGKAVHDVVLAMRGEEPSNPPNPRSKRKFEAGNLFEWTVRLVLRRSGILLKTQERVKCGYPGLIEVSGKIDFEAGGTPTYDEALGALDELELPDVIQRGTVALIDYLKANYPNGLEKKIIEVKSSSAFMFDAMERTGKCSRNHRMQLLHYIKGKGYPSGTLIYICRDDLRMMEIEVFLDAETEAEYKSEIEEVSRVYQKNEQVPLEPMIVYDEDTERFSKNWKVCYSQYLTKLYGIKDQAEFDDTYQGTATRWNAVLNRMRAANLRKEWLADRGCTEVDVQYEKIEGKRTKKHFIAREGGLEYLPEKMWKGYEMTPKNLEAIKEMETVGFAPVTLAERMKEPAPEEDEEANSAYLATDV